MTQITANMFENYGTSHWLGPDKLIPSSVFAKAKGIAIISYTRMGFFVSARGGSGIVVAKLPNGGKFDIN